MTPEPCAAAQGMTSPAEPRRMAENGGCTESTCRIASARSSNPTVKLATPMARTLSSSTKRTISAHESSRGVIPGSGQWNW